MTKTQSLVQSIGLSNLITIVVLVVGLTSTFVGLSANLNKISDRLENEIIDRKVEDERLRLEIAKNWDTNSADHQRLTESLENISESIKQLDSTMEYHIGYHVGKGDKK